MFVAQNPGISKSKYKKPKVFAVWENPNDRLFIKNLGLVGIKRDDIYVTNMVKCSTVSNNAPEESQTVACRRHLSLEIAFLKPQVIVAVGGIARKYFKGEMGGWTKWNGIDVFGIWHPSYILRAGIGSSADEEHKKMLENQWRNTQLAVVVQHPAFKKIKVEPFIIQDVEVD
jgi:DNA polymerase